MLFESALDFVHLALNVFELLVHIYQEFVLLTLSPTVLAIALVVLLPVVAVMGCFLFAQLLLLH